MDLATSPVVCGELLDARYLLGFLSEGRMARDAEELASQNGEAIWTQHRDLVVKDEMITSTCITSSGALALSLFFICRLSDSAVGALSELFKHLGHADDAARLESHWCMTNDILSRRSLSSRVETIFYSKREMLRWVRPDSGGTYVMATSICAALRSGPQPLSCFDDEENFVRRITDTDHFRAGMLTISSELRSRFAGVVACFDSRRLLADIFVFRFFMMICGETVSAELTGSAAVRDALLDMGDVVSALDCLRRARRKPLAPLLAFHGAQI
jgi:hypothetical protein